MDQQPFVVRVAAWPARLIAALAGVSCLGALAILALVGKLLTLPSSPETKPMNTALGVFFVVTAVVLLVAAALIVAVARREARGLRYPPVFTSAGLRLHMVGRGGYDVLVPWGRVSRLRFGYRSARPYLMVHATDAADLVGDDPRTRRRLRRATALFDGASFAYGLRSAFVDPDELAEAVHRLSDATVTLEREPR